ncbi:nitroreductase family protein [Sphingobium sp.]|uniref:nitroreductase family protein n=1 Tax=Sphingobium sp. TaxID=1912891 RepID=UPI002611EE39|nr:nitroreductase family protein [Sphingobium sp.]
MTRSTDLDIVPFFLDRWSPRAMDGGTMPHDALLKIMEAGRWAPSAYNYQPWRFVYTHRDDANWQASLDLLIPFNRSWAQSASALLFILSEETMGDPNSANHSHSFDAGAAWAYMSIQAHLSGYQTHGMTGLDYDKAKQVLGVPDGYRVEAAIAVGKRGDPAQLPEQLQGREGPSDRRPLDQTIFAGRFSL